MKAPQWAGNFNSFDASLIIRELDLICRLHSGARGMKREIFLAMRAERKKAGTRETKKNVENALAIKRDVNWWWLRSACTPASHAMFAPRVHEICRTNSCARQQKGNLNQPDSVSCCHKTWNLGESKLRNQTCRSNLLACRSASASRTHSPAAAHRRSSIQQNFSFKMTLVRCPHMQKVLASARGGELM